MLKWAQVPLAAKQQSSPLSLHPGTVAAHTTSHTELLPNSKCRCEHRPPLLGLVRETYTAGNRQSIPARFGASWQYASVWGHLRWVFGVTLQVRNQVPLH